MKKFFTPYYNLFNIFKINNKAKEISKLSDLIKLVKDEGNDLTRNFLLNKTFDYNYANIYLKTEQQEMKYLPNKNNRTSDFGNVDIFSFKKDSNDNLNKPLNTDIKSFNESRMGSEFMLLPLNENENIKYKITIESSELNLIKQNSNNSFNEKYNDLFSNKKVSQFYIGSQCAEVSNKKERDNFSDISNNRKRDNSVDIASMNSYESSELLTIKKSTMNKNNIGNK